jgi:hypothetical protein
MALSVTGENVLRGGEVPAPLVKARRLPISRSVASERPWGWASMIYILAFFVPPLALLLNGQVFAAILNVVLLVPCLILGLVFHVLLLIPSAHAIIAIYHERENRKHREIVEAIREHGSPPGWRP